MSREKSMEKRYGILVKFVSHKSKEKIMRKRRKL